MYKRMDRRVLTVGKRVLRVDKQVTTSGEMSSASTASGQDITMSDQTSFASTTRDKMGSAIIITLN